MKALSEFIGCCMFAACLVIIPFHALPQGLKKYADKQKVEKKSIDFLDKTDRMPLP